jgi:hypothetical protein
VGFANSEAVQLRAWWAILADQAPSPGFRPITINAERTSDRISVTHNMNGNNELC